MELIDKQAYVEDLAQNQSRSLLSLMFKKATYSCSKIYGHKSFLFGFSKNKAILLALSKYAEMPQLNMGHEQNL